MPARETSAGGRAGARSLPWNLPLSAALALGALTIAVGAPQRQPRHGSTLRVHADFPGGSASVRLVDSQRRVVQITPAPHPDRGWNCWWYFKLSGLTPGETLALTVGGMSFALPDQAHFSLDGRRWRHTTPGERARNTITYRQRVDAREAWFAWGPPFLLEDARALVGTATARHPDAVELVLTESAEGRAVPALRVAAADRSPPSHAAVWIQARQHAWESGSSWVAKGLTNWLLSDDVRARALRRRAEFHIVPIMDVDNVERGAGGKNQKPRDHNRDWSDTPHWPEVRAAGVKLRELAHDGRLKLFIDLHNPAPGDREVMVFDVPAALLNDTARENKREFIAAAQSEISGPLKLSARQVETGPSYDPGWDRIASVWVQRTLGRDVVAITLETPWNTPESTIAGYEQVGQQLGCAIERYLAATFP